MTRHNKLWLILILLGWAALFLSAPIIHGYAPEWDWPTFWHEGK
jgi:hypothetical protein